MRPTASIYIQGVSFIHRLDPRVKLAVLAVYSCALLFVSGWWGMALMGALFLLVLGVSRIPASRVFGCGAVVYMLAVIAILFNTARLDGAALALSLAGFETGCLYALRILLLFWMSLLLCFTSTSTSLTEGFAKLLRPLRALHVPVDDVALVLSLALRFIPLTSAEYAKIRASQRARCAHFDDGTLWQRLRAAGNSLIPLFVGLFRRADRLSFAMEARCYGVSQAEQVVERASLTRLRLGVSDLCTLCGALALCIGIAVFL